jgi:mannosyl-oligosaccharide glucosidase
LDDPENNLILTTQWLKVPGGEHGGSWAARIKGHKSDYGMLTVPFRRARLLTRFKICCQGKPLRTSVVFYATIEGLGALDLENDEAPNVGHRVLLYNSL